ncbi:hypothetical protein GCM10022221_63550 [Actinocorallia aurea]
MIRPASVIHPAGPTTLGVVRHHSASTMAPPSAISESGAQAGALSRTAGTGGRDDVVMVVLPAFAPTVARHPLISL